MASPRAKLAPAWTFARWSSGALLAALAAGACQLDDRTLTGSHLLDSRGIAVRAGHHCARPLHERFGVQSSTRASFYLYTSDDEIDRLASALILARDTFKL